MRLRVAVLSLLPMAVITAGDPPGIPARPVSEYAAHVTANGVTLAATVLPPDQVKKLFSKDLSHAGYIVLEVAVIPDNGAAADVTSGEFTLRVGTDPAILSALSPRSVAGGEKPMSGAKGKNVPAKLPGNVQVYQTETVGYESGGYGRKGGVYTASSTTVGVGNPSPGGYPRDPRCDYPGGYPPGNGPNRYPAGCAPPPVSDPQQKQPKDQAGLRQELEDKALPEGKTSTPVAGYLYFERPNSKQKNPDYGLSWLRVSGDMRLTLPAVK